MSADITISCDSETELPGLDHNQYGLQHSHGHPFSGMEPQANEVDEMRCGATLLCRCDQFIRLRSAKPPTSSRRYPELSSFNRIRNFPFQIPARPVKGRTEHSDLAVDRTIADVPSPAPFDIAAYLTSLQVLQNTARKERIQLFYGILITFSTSLLTARSIQIEKHQLVERMLTWRWEVGRVFFAPASRIHWARKAAASLRLLSSARGIPVLRRVGRPRPSIKLTHQNGESGRS